MTVKTLLEEQKKHLNYYFEHVNVSDLEKAVSLVLQTKGLIVLTGVGKSGIIAEKIAMTLVSTGTKALFLPPLNFLHGDIGILSENDLLIMLSRSGETEELLNLIPFVKKRKTSLLAVISNPTSRLGKAADATVILPVEKELCPFDLAPTTSTTVQLLFGDLLAIHLMHLKKFNLASYIENHPSGALGKKATMRVEDVMFKEEQIPLARPTDRLIDVLVELTNKKCGALLIVDEEKQLKGIFTDGDLRRALQVQGSKALDSSMEKLMTEKPVSVEKDTLVIEALKRMQRDPKKYVMVLPVLDQNRVVGVLRMHDVIQSGIA